MKIGFLTVSLLLASVAFAREEDTPLDENIAPKIEKSQGAKPKEDKDIIKPKATVISDTPKVKADGNTEDTAKKKIVADESTKKKVTPLDEIAKKKTVPTNDEAAKKKVTTTIDDGQKKKQSKTDETIKKKISTTADEAPKKQSMKATNVITPQKNVLVTPDAPKKKSLPIVEVIVPTPPTTVSVSALAGTRSATTTASSTAEAILSQRQQQSLIDNAVKIDGMNRELLTQNEKLQLENEKLTQQLELLQNDHSAENMRNGAFFVVLGLFLGWLLVNAPRQRKKW